MSKAPDHRGCNVEIACRTLGKTAEAIRTGKALADLCPVQVIKSPEKPSLGFMRIEFASQSGELSWNCIRNLFELGEP